MTITPAEFRERWGEGEFSCCPPGKAQGLDPPAAAFLVEVGLPRQCDPNFQFHLDEGAPRVESRGRVYRRIGAEEDFAAICLDERGAVWALDAENEFPPQFMNSSVPALAECLLLYRESVGRTETEPLPERQLVQFLGVSYDVTPPARQNAEAIRAELTRLRRDIAEVDRAALADSGTWWSQRIEDEENQYA